MEAEAGAAEAAGAVTARTAAGRSSSVGLWRGEATPRTIPDIENDSTFRSEKRLKNDSIFILSRRNTVTNHLCSGNGKSILLGSSKHGVVVAQPGRKGAPLNPDAPETGETANYYNYRRKTNHAETQHSNQLPR